MRAKIVFIGIAVLAAAGGIVWLQMRAVQPDKEQQSLISPAIGSIESMISSTGTVLPKNRLEIKPPVNGRVEQLLVAEGQKVNARAPGDVRRLAA